MVFMSNNISDQSMNVQADLSLCCIHIFICYSPVYFVILYSLSIKYVVDIRLPCLGSSIEGQQNIFYREIRKINQNNYCI